MVNSDILSMILRNPKTALKLMPSYVIGNVFSRGKSDKPVQVISDHPVTFDFTYQNKGNEKFRELYTKGTKNQWRKEDLDWSISVDHEDDTKKLFPDTLLPMYHEDYFRTADKRHKQRVSHATISWLLSQFLHGEQGALFAASQTIEAVPWIDGKLYGSTQVLDEARHMDVFETYIKDKCEKLYKINDNLFTIIHALASDPEWDIKFLGMQIMVEGLALGAFSLLYRNTKEPLLTDLLKRVIADEARHVHYGVTALKDFYTKEVSESFRREREDWAYEVAVMLRNRFFFLEVYDEFYGHKVSKDAWIKMILRSDVMAEFRTSLFSRLIPNLRDIGLLTDRIKPKYAELGVLKFENLPSAAH
jgi:hypothetical protein